MTKEERDIIEGSLCMMAEEIRHNLDTTGTNASGRTSASLEIRLTENGGSLLGRKFFQGVEEGRHAGKTPAGFRDIIRQWIIDKGVDVTPLHYKTERRHKYSESEMSLNAAAGAIAYRIRQSGTSLYRMGGRKDIYSNVFDKYLPQLSQQLASVYVQKYFSQGANTNNGYRDQNSL